MTRLFACLVSVLIASCATPGEPVEISHIHGLGIDAADPGAVYVATHYGLFVNDDGEWSQRSEDAHDHMGFTLVSGDLMFRSGHPDTGGNLGVERSTDGGRTWERISPDTDRPWDFHAMTATREDPPLVIGWDSGGLGVFRSLDGGDTWAVAEAAGLPRLVGAFAAAPDGVLYASTEVGLLRSTDRGDTWEPTGDESVFALAAARDVLYASRNEEVIRSTDEGATWEATGLEGAALVVALTATPDGRTVVAADRDNTVWRSDDAGATWTSIPPP